MKTITLYWPKVIKFLTKIPATLSLIFITLFIGAHTKALWVSAEQSGLVDKYGYGLEAIKNGELANIFIGAFISPEPWMYITVMIPLLIGGGYLEYRYGALRMIIALIASHIFSVIFVAGILLIFSNINVGWAVELSKTYDVGMSNAAFGALGAATAGLAVSLKIRLRVGISLFLLAMVLFSGSIWDLTHFSAFGFGILIGPWIIGKGIKINKPTIKNIDKRVLTSMIVLFIAIANIITKVYPGNGGLLAFNEPNAIHPTSTAIMLVSSAIYILISYGLYRGRYYAWVVSLVMATVIILSSFFEPNNSLFIFDLIVGISLMLMLIAFKDSFKVKANKATAKQLILASLITAVVIFATHILLIYVLKHSFTPIPSLTDSLKESLHQTVGIPESILVPNNTTARLITEFIDTFWIIYLLMVMAALVISTSRNHSNKVSKEDYTKLLKHKGGSNIAWMGTWPHIRYWANATKTTIIAYRLINNVAIVLSDPIGSYQSTTKALKQFDKYCYQKGWEPTYFSVDNKTKNYLKSCGYNGVPIGEDTIIKLPNLEFTGKSWQSVRSAINKASKIGITMKTINYNDAPLAIKDQLHTIADSWVADKSLPEMGFTLGTLDQAKDPAVIMNIAIDGDGTIHGMSSWLPIYGKNKQIGWTIDIMQRRLSKNTMPGVIEYLIAESAMEFKNQGFNCISLSAAPLASAKAPNGALEKLLNFMSVRLEPYYGFKSLYNFKKKFNPVHNTIYLCYKDPAKLPAITMAITKAYTNDKSLIKTALATIK